MKERDLTPNVRMLLLRAAEKLRPAPAISDDDDLAVACDEAKTAATMLSAFDIAALERGQITANVAAFHAALHEVKTMTGDEGEA